MQLAPPVACDEDELDATDELDLLEETTLELELATDDAGLLEELTDTTELDLLVDATELDLLDATELELLLTGAVEFGFLPTKYRLGAAGADMPSPKKKLVCGGWLYATF